MYTLVLRTLTMVMLLVTFAPVTSAQVLPLTGCARSAVATEWQGSFTFSYSGAANDEDRNASVQQSASYNLSFGDFRAAEPGIFRARWEATDTSGSISINDSGFEGGQMITQAEGPPLPSEFIGELGHFEIRTDTCTYTLTSSLAVNAINDLNPSDGLQDRADIGALSWQVSRALNESADLVISGSASLPVVFSLDNPDADYAGPNGGHVANTLQNIIVNQGVPNAGFASVNWTMRPIAPQPKISDVQLLHLQYPSGDPAPLGAEGVVDGDPVLIRATLENPTNAVLTVPVSFRDGENGQLLPNGDQSQLLPPKSSLVVQYALDTTGWTWTRQAAAGAPPTAHPDNSIQIRLGSDQNLYDTQTKPLRVRARPVVLVHGLNSNSGTWNKYPGFLHEINFTWKAYPVHLQTGYDIMSQQRSELLVKNARTLRDWVEHVRRTEQTWQVDVVAHSMGGLISREYIHSMMPVNEDGQPAVRHLIMLGTPNRGSSCAYLILGINLLHDIPNLLAPLELMPESVAKFNARVFNQKGTIFSVLVGDDQKFKCELTNLEPSDDVVLASSARYTFVHAYTDSAHTEMTESHSDFVRFVMPMLLDRTHTARTTPQSGLLLDAQPAQSVAPIQLSQVISQTIAPGASLEIPLAVPQADQAAVLLSVAPGVAATLISPDGSPVATSPAGSAPIGAWFRTLQAEQPAAGVWQLRLNSSETTATTVIVAVQTAGAPLELSAAGIPSTDGRATLTLRLTEHDTPVIGASVTATLVGSGGERTEHTLFDDGQHDDGGAGDGLYATRSEPLADGSYAILLEARHGEAAGITVAAFTIGSSETTTTVFLPLLDR